MYKKYFLFSFLVLFSAVSFFTFNIKIASAAVVCSDGATNCGYVASYAIPLVRCNTGTTTTQYETCSNSGSFPVGEFPDPSHPTTYTGRVFTHSGGYVHMDQPDDNGSASIGSWSYSYTDCSCGASIQSVNDGTCANGNFHGTTDNNVTIPEGGTLTVTATNQCKANGSGIWGGNSASAVSQMTSCLNDAMDATPAKAGTYQPSADGVCTFVAPIVTPPATPPILDAKLSNGDVSMDIYLVAGQTSASASFSYSNRGSGSLTVINCPVVTSYTKSFTDCADVLGPNASGTESVTVSGIPTGLSGNTTIGITVNAYNTASTSQTFSVPLAITIHPAPPTPPSGTISATDCTITSGNRTCVSSVAWSVSNAVSGATTEVKTDNPAATVSSSLATSGANVSRSINFGYSSFVLDHNGTRIASQDNVLAVCATGLQWILDNTDGYYKCLNPTGSPTANLVLGALSPTSAKVGTPVTFAISVNNQSTVASTGGTTVRFDLASPAGAALNTEPSSSHRFFSWLARTAEAVTGTVAPMSSVSIGALNPGQISTASSAPKTFATAGAYSIRACIVATPEVCKDWISLSVVPADTIVSACGSDDKQTLSSTPTNTCAANNSLVGSVSGSGPWSWSCQNGSAVAVTCSASKSATPTGAACGSPTLGQYGAPSGNLCQTGYSASSVNIDYNNRAYIWGCSISGSSSSCSSPYTGPINGQCGAAQNEFSPGGPTDYYPGYMCYTGTTGTVTEGQNGSWNYTCNGSNGGTNASCATAHLSEDTCYIRNAKATKTELFYGQETTISWDSNCQVGVTGAARKTIGWDVEGNPIYSTSYYMNPGTATLKAYYHNAIGWSVLSNLPAVPVTVAGYDYGIKVTNLSTHGGFFYQGETAKFKVEMPFNTTFYNYYDTDQATPHYVAYAFPSSLLSTSFSLRGQPNPQEGDGVSYVANPETGETGIWYSMYPRDASNRYESPYGSFSPATLTSSGTWVSTWSVPIPSNALTGWYRYNVQTGPVGGGTAVTQIGITVQPNTIQPVVALSSSRYSLISGQNATLTWTSNNVTSCTSTNFSNGAALSGSVVVTPITTTTYTVTCNSASGPVSSNATIIVTNANGVAPVVTFTARPNFITPGKQATLTWNATGADSCVGDGNFSTGASSVTSGTAVVSPLATTTYTLTCTNNGTNASRTSKVTVTKFEFKER